MHVDGQPFRSIRYDAGHDRVEVIDQRWLPHEFRVVALDSLTSFAAAIRDMWVRGAPLIGATAAWGIARQMRRDPGDASLDAACEQLRATRPTAVNLHWALEAMRRTLLPLPDAERGPAAPTRHRRSAMPTWPTTAPSASTDSRSSRRSPSGAAPIRHAPANRCGSSRTAMRAGWPPSTGARQRRRSTPRTTPASRSTSGWTRPDRETRAPR